MGHAEYLKPLFNPLLLDRVVKVISQELREDSNAGIINCIAVTGVSGAVIGGILSYLTSLPLVIVRKGEFTHSDNKLVEFPNRIEGIAKAAFVDDLIASGKTVERVEELLKSEVKGELGKIYLYADSDYSIYKVNGKKYAISGRNFVTCPTSYDYHLEIPPLPDITLL